MNEVTEMTSQNPVWLNKLGRDKVSAVERDRQRMENLRHQPEKVEGTGTYSNQLPGVGIKEYGAGHNMESHGEGRSLEDLVKKRFHTKQTNAIRSGRTHGLDEYKKSDEFRNSKFGQDYLSREE